MNYGAPFVEARGTNTALELFVSNLVPGASPVSYTRHVRMTKLVLRKPLSFEYFESTAASTIGMTHLDDIRLAFCSDSDAVPPS